MQIHQINLQRHFGGGEVYTAFLCRALDKLGVVTHLYIHPQAAFWTDLQLPASTQLLPTNSWQNLNAEICPHSSWFLGHGALPQELCQKIHTAGGIATAIAHMPVQGRNPDVFRNHDQVFAVSRWVVNGLISADLPAWPTPLYGVANLKRTYQATQIRRRSRYDWDLRKGRDRVLSWIEPLIDPLLPHPAYARNTGLTLGIVSRITPIKQFPLLFSILAPVLSRFPTVNIEIFGSGGYGSVRDLTKALEPIADRTRFWGHQSDVASVYKEIDFLLTGLPEKEALGLNIIEAQACGTPVIAPNSPPFTETILHDRTGYLYTDPRLDDGADFSRLLQHLLNSAEKIHPEYATEHMQTFSFDAFVERMAPIVEWAKGRLA